MYHYHTSTVAPFTIGCYGPVDTLEQCKGLYDTCGDAATDIDTANGCYKDYDLFCPCFKQGDDSYNQVTAGVACAATTSGGRGAVELMNYAVGLMFLVA